jgi:hypothetical protein
MNKNKNPPIILIRHLMNFLITTKNLSSVLVFLLIIINGCQTKTDNISKNVEQLVIDSACQNSRSLYIFRDGIDRASIVKGIKRLKAPFGFTCDFYDVRLPLHPSEHIVYAVRGDTISLVKFPGKPLISNILNRWFDFTKWQLLDSTQMFGLHNMILELSSSAQTETIIQSGKNIYGISKKDLEGLVVYNIKPPKITFSDTMVVITCFAWDFYGGVLSKEELCLKPDSLTFNSYFLLDKIGEWSPPI